MKMDEGPRVKVLFLKKIVFKLNFKKFQFTTENFTYI